MSEPALETRPHRAARPRHGRRRLRRAARRAGRRGRGRLRPAAGDLRRPHPRGGGLRGDPRRLRPDRRADRRHRARPRARARRAAGRQAGGDREQAAARPARRRALRGRPRGGRADPLRGGGRRGDPDRPRDPGELRGDRGLEGLRDRQRDDQLHPQRDGGDRRRLRGRAGAGQGARLRGGGPDRGRQRGRRRGEDGDPRPPRLPHAGDARTTSPTRASRRSSPTTSPTRRSWASR